MHQYAYAFQFVYTTYAPPTLLTWTQLLSSLASHWVQVVVPPRWRRPAPAASGLGFSDSFRRRRPGHGPSRRASEHWAGIMPMSDSLAPSVRDCGTASSESHYQNLICFQSRWWLGCWPCLSLLQCHGLRRAGVPGRGLSLASLSFRHGASHGGCWVRSLSFIV